MRRPPKRDWPMIAASLSMREQHQLMQRVLQREHARADRNGQPFSLVVLHIDRLASHRAVRRLFAAIRDRARLTDEIGWLDNDRLAILLPETNDIGAQQFTAHLRDLRQFSAVMPRLSVHVYPPTPVAAPASPAAAREIDATLEIPVRFEIPATTPGMEAAWQQ
ncbi:MAG: hypothetical protein IT447_04010 [Phycisphaerales bacterium]|nr:hypothetical protein [Phycisphaerales bacterium]